MFTRLWSRQATSKQAAHRGRRRKPLPRLRLEPLEDRCLPSGFSTGPLLLISNPDPLANSPPGFRGAGVTTEPQVTVNPADPNNIAAIWIDDGYAGNVVGASHDGGQTWQNVALPGLTLDTGGTSAVAGNPWISFAPNGALYASSLTFATKGGEVQVNKLPNGGPTWSNPIVVSEQDDGTVDKPSLTADPTDSRYVYATWARFNGAAAVQGNNAATMFARSTDGGQTWQPAQDIHDAQGSDFNWGHQIVVLPDGTVIDAFTEGQFKNNHPGVLTLLRSTDHGQTWSAPIAAVVQQPLIDPSVNPPNALVTDPDTGQGVEAHPMFPSVAVDRTSGNLYAVWIDGRFSNFQYNSIALSMSSDSGLTWSNPIQVNQTPNSVPPIDRQAWNPAVAVAADSTVAVSYYDFRNNTPAPGALTDYWLATCHPSTTTPATNPANWSELRLTNSSFNLEQAPTRFGGDFWLGDSEGLAAAGKDFVAVWSMPDGTSTGMSSIFFRRAISGEGGISRAARAPTRVVANGRDSNFARLFGVADGSGTTSPTHSLPVAGSLTGIPGGEPVNRGAALPAGPLAAARQHRGFRFLSDPDAGLLADGYPGEPGA
jgi:hypothetical protein